MAQDAKKQKKPPAAGKPAPKAQPAVEFKSSELVEESGEESDPNLDEDSESGEEDALANSTAPTPKTNGKTAEVAAGSSESGSESSETGSAEEDSSEDDEDEGTTVTKAPVKIQPAKQTTKSSSSRTVSFKDASSFVPPRGFQLISMNDEDAPRASKLFKKSNLEGKQIWYITAPASVPLASIEEMALRAVKKGTAVVSHNGSNYGFTENAVEEKGYTKIIIPISTDDGYRTGATMINRILHLQQIVELPSIHTVVSGDVAPPTLSSQATIPAKKPVRQQPKGLKMRFTPIGSGSRDSGKIGTSESDSDLDMEDATLKFRTPITPSKSESSDLESDVEMNDAPTIPAKEAKSNRSSKAQNATAPIEKTLKRKHKDAGSAGTNKSSSPSSSTNGPQLKKSKEKAGKIRRS